jgi:hypothetical protein
MSQYTLDELIIINATSKISMKELKHLCIENITLFQNGTLIEPDVFLLDVYKTSTVQPLNVSITGLAFLSHDNEEGCFRVLFTRRAPITQRRSNLHGALFKTATVVHVSILLV